MANDLRSVSASPQIASATLGFLTDLEAHNERSWFETHKERYLVAHANMIDFADDLLARMRRYDKLSNTDGRSSLLRVYADQRFHKDRPPYTPRFGMRLARVKPALRGGYFLQLRPGDRSQVTCGFMGPEPDDLRLIRQDIAYDHVLWRRLLNAKNLRSHLGELFGEEVATVPRGYAKDHPAADLLRKKQFLLRRTFMDKEVLDTGFAAEVVKTCRAVRPWFDHLSALLTSDGNGT